MPTVLPSRRRFEDSADPYVDSDPTDQPQDYSFLPQSAQVRYERQDERAAANEADRQARYQQYLKDKASITGEQAPTQSTDTQPQPPAGLSADDLIDWHIYHQHIAPRVATPASRVPTATELNGMEKQIPKLRRTFAVGNEVSDNMRDVMSDADTENNQLQANDEVTKNVDDVAQNAQKRGYISFVPGKKNQPGSYVGGRDVPYKRQWHFSLNPFAGDNSTVVSKGSGTPEGLDISGAANAATQDQYDERNDIEGRLKNLQQDADDLTTQAKRAGLVPLPREKVFLDPNTGKKFSFAPQQGDTTNSASDRITVAPAASSTTVNATSQPSQTAVQPAQNSGKILVTSPDGVRGFIPSNRLGYYQSIGYTASQ